MAAEPSRNARLLRHLWFDHCHARRAFPESVLSRIEATIARGEELHRGEIRFVVEPSLAWRRVLSGQTARERARELFGKLGIWDTAENNGVLVYVLLADHSAEIVADRGVARVIDSSAWLGVLEPMLKGYREGD